MPANNDLSKKFNAANGNDVSEEVREQFFDLIEKQNLSKIKTALQKYPDAITWRDQSEDRKTPLIRAVEKGNIPLIELLISAGASANIVSSRESAPIMFAAWEGKRDAVEILFRKGGAAVDARNKEGVTALMCAAHKGFEDIARLLLQLGADPSLTNNAGATAEDFAGKQGHDNIIAVLKAGAPPAAAAPAEEPKPVGDPTKDLNSLVKKLKAGKLTG